MGLGQIASFPVGGLHYIRLSYLSVCLNSLHGLCHGGAGVLVVLVLAVVVYPPVECCCVEKTLLLLLDVGILLNNIIPTDVSYFVRTGQ